MGQGIQGVAGGILASPLLAAAGTAAFFLARHEDSDGEDLVMVWTGLGHDLVSRRRFEPILRKLLQHRLVVELHEKTQITGKGLFEDGANDRVGRGKAAVDEDGADDGLEGVGKQRVAATTATERGAFAHDERLADLELARELGQGFFVHQGGTDARQLAFGETFTTFHEPTADGEAEDGVTEEFQTFVPRQIQRRRMGAQLHQGGAVRQRFIEKRPIDEFVAEPLFESRQTLKGSRMAREQATELGLPLRAARPALLLR